MKGNILYTSSLKLEGEGKFFYSYCFLEFLEWENK